MPIPTDDPIDTEVPVEDETDEQPDFPDPSDQTGS